LDKKPLTGFGHWEQIGEEFDINSQDAGPEAIALVPAGG